MDLLQCITKINLFSAAQDCQILFYWLVDHYYTVLCVDTIVLSVHTVDAN